MAEPKETRDQQPHGRRDRDSAEDGPRKRHDYVAGANGDQDIDASEADAKDSQQPDKDGTGW